MSVPHTWIPFSMYVESPAMTISGFAIPSACPLCGSSARFVVNLVAVSHYADLIERGVEFGVHSSFRCHRGCGAAGFLEWSPKDPRVVTGNAILDA